jgi:hypothetical protein
MCIVSDKIKFCTCTSADLDELPHYWLLHRFNKEKDEFILGQPRIPLSYYEPYYKLNKEIFAQRLNEPDSFDFEFHFRDNDRLVIVLNNLSADEDQRMTFCFSYNKEKWVPEQYNLFELANHYDELKFGQFKQMENK